MDILKPDFKLFKKKYDSGIKQVLFTSFAADVHTPISSLLKLENEKYLFLFESVERGSQKGKCRGRQKGRRRAKEIGRS